MNPWLAVAALAAFPIFPIHTVVDSRRFARAPLAARDRPRVPRLTVCYGGQRAGLRLFGMAAALARAAHHGIPAPAVTSGAMAAAFAVPSLGLIAGRRVKPWHMPQWALFVPVAALAGLGLS